MIQRRESAARSRRHATRSSTRRLAAAHIVSPLFVISLTACAQSTADDVAEEYTPPGWMAEMAQANDEFYAFHTQCMLDAGYPIAMTIDGVTSSDRPMTEAQQKADWTCYEATVAAVPVPEQSAEIYYERVLDTARCLEDQGYDNLGTPPSEESWAQAYTSEGDLWSPYGQLYAANPQISESEWYRLKSICIEDGVSFGLSFQEPDPAG